SATFALQVPRANLPEALDLLRQVLREPSLPAEEFEILRREQLANLEESRTEPSALAQIAVERKLKPYPKDNVRYVPTVDESIERTKALTLDQVKKLYADYLGAGAGELTIVGDFDPEPTLSLIRPALQGWRSKMPYARVVEKAAENVATSTEKIETPDKANATSLAGFGLAMDDLHPDYPAMVVANHVFGGTSAGRLF